MPIAPDMSPTGTIETPAMRGKRQRTDELGERVVVARNWRYATYLIAVSLLGTIGIIAYLVARLAVRDIVYIERNATTGEMRVAATGNNPPSVRQETVKKELREFVEVIRRVSPDKDMMQRQWKAVFTKVTPRGYRLLSAYAQEIDPLVIEGERRVEILRILAKTEQTYDIRWTETTYNDGGTLLERVTYSGIFIWQARQGSKTISLEELTANPAGIYFDWWEWSNEK